MAKKIPVSFKENVRDIELYSFLVNMDDKSSYIKKAIRFFKEYEEKLYQNKKNND